MKKIIRILSAAFILLSALMTASCSDDGTDKKDSEILAEVRATLTDDSIAAGTGTSLSVIGIYADNTTADFSTQVIWISSNPAVATVDANGNVTALAAGTTTITALYGFYGDSVTLTVTNAFLTSISVTPVTPDIANTTSQPFTATGFFSDASTQDITLQASWSSSDTNVATIDTSGYATSTGKGTTTIRASYGSYFGSTTLTVSAGKLLSISLSPPNPSIANGTTQQFAATGLFEDNTTQTLTGQVDWYSSNTQAATIDVDGLATAVGTEVGVNWTSIINAVHPASGVAGSGTTLTVTPADLVSLSVSPLNKSIANGTSWNFTATGTYTDTTTQDLTTQVNWYSYNTTVADIGLNTGLATGNTQGFTIINAVHPGTSIVSNDSTLTVTPAELASIAIDPPDVEKPLGLTEQFTATGTYTDASSQDITDAVTWSSSNTNAVTMDNVTTKGEATAQAVGTAFINAVDPTTGIAASASGGEAFMNVTSADLLFITIDPPGSEKPLGLAEQFTAFGNYTNNTRQNITTSVTWSSSDDTVVDIGPSTGLATAIGNGTAIIINAVDSASGIFASDSGGQAFMNATSAVLDSIVITNSPANTVLNFPGYDTWQFEATGIYSDATTQPFTDLVTWFSSDDTVVDIGPSTGLATAIGNGTAIIINAIDPVSGIFASDSGGQTGIMNVLSLDTIEVTPSPATVPVDQTVRFTAMGNLSDLSQIDITNDVLWDTSDVSVAIISNTTGSKGRALGISGGTAYINATAAGKTSSDTRLEVITLDLTVEIYNVDCINSPGQQVTVFYNTTNSGNADAGAFLVDVWDLLGSPPSVGDLGDGTESFTGLAAGASILNSTTISSTNTSGFAYAVVDGTNIVAESDETNNVSNDSNGFWWNNAYCSEGTSSSPISLSPLPSPHHVGTSYSYYQFTGLSAGTSYTIKLSDPSNSTDPPTDDVDLYVDDGGSQWCSSTADGVTTESCPITPDTTVLNVMVDGTKTSRGAAYRISIF